MKYLVLYDDEINPAFGDFLEVTATVFGEKYIDYIDATLNSFFYRLWILDSASSDPTVRYNYKASRILNKDIYGPMLICVPKNVPTENKVIEDGLREDEILNIVNALKEVV